ncbi:MAG: prephenate dehydrogenase/arogenate dehydrogenase family protein [Verrucomicrobiota bacterium]
MFPFSDTTLAVFGPGLLGGSLLLEARARGVRQVRVWGRRETSLQQVRERNLADFSSTDACETAKGADLLILAVPVGAMAGLAGEICRASLPPEAVVTDVGSVKAAVLAGAGEVCRQAGIAFVGSHPMAGAETPGLDAARAGLFEKAACLLTPDSATDPAALEKVDCFWQAIGCRTSRLDAHRHDEVVARISHLPHLSAVAATLAAFRPDASMAQFAAGGLRDTTRVASGLPSMWREILMENRTAILPTLKDLHHVTGELLEILGNEDDDRLLAFLEEARRLRATRYS